MGKLPLLVSSLDSLLGGGLEPEIITNVYGASGSGKTNFALQSVVSCISQGKKVIYVDPEGSFSVERYLQMRPNKDSLKSVILFEPKTFEEQEEAIFNISKLVKSERVGLVVVDSIVALYRICSHKDVGMANSMLSKQFAELSKIAKENRIPVLVTNQVYSDFDSGELELVGGDIPKYSSKCIIYLKKVGAGRRRATLIKHRSRPEGGTAEFVIRNEGLVDVGKKFGIF